MDKVNVLFATDKNYLPYLECSLKSLLAHNENLSVFVLNTGDIPLDWAENLQPYFAQRRSELKLCYLNQASLNHFEDNGYISRATYLRYYIEDLFQYASTPYWIYLDCDIAINGDITLPFQPLKASKYAIAAVSDPYVNSIADHPYKHQDYFNAGILYFEANRCRGIKTDLIKLTEQLKNQIIFGDQDILNVYFQDNWLKLDNLSNFQLDHILYKKQTVGRGKTAPYILHFTGPNKPLGNVSSSDENVRAVIALFRAYHQLSWDNIVNLPLGSIKLTL